MSTSEFDLDSFLESPGMDAELAEQLGIGSTEGIARVPYFEPGYEGKIDPRIRQLSYSSLLTLHSCPRKFELYKKRSTHRTEEALKSTITFAFGHVVGEGIQLVLASVPMNEVIWKMFLMWHTPELLQSDEKANKSFFSAVFAVQKFAFMREAGFLDEYELVYYNGKPACELGFRINFPDGFALRGYVDAVLRSRETGKILVLECKTTGSKNINPATYKNSSQAIGYSIVLDVLFPSLSSYDVLYLVYQTTEREFHPIPFTKSYLQRALWIQDLLFDIEVIKMYDESGIYPMRGESCMSFFRECEYLQTCHLSTEYLTKVCTEEEVDSEVYDVNIGLEDLLTAQLERS